MNISRRGFWGALTGALPACVALSQEAWPVFKIGGLDFEIETFSFHDLPPAGDQSLIPTLI